MRKFERIVGIFVFLLFIYKVLFGSYFDVLLRIVLILFAIFYLWCGFFLFNRTSLVDLLNREVRQRISAFKTAAGIVMGMVYSFCILAIMYNIYFYSAMNFFLISAIIALVSSTTLVGVYNTLNMPLQSFYNQIYRRSLIFGVFLFAFWLTPIDTRLEVFYKDHPGFIEAYKEYRENPDDPETQEKLKDERRYIK
ncbi:MAG: hypothetical protein ACOCWC_01730 [Bacteroidota bacterium]